MLFKKEGFAKYNEEFFKSKKGRMSCDSHLDFEIL